MNNPYPTPRPKITFIVTLSVSTAFFRGQLAYMVNHGWDVDMVSGPGPQLEAMATQGATPWAIPMQREIAPFEDIVSLWRLWRLLRRTRPDLVVAGTPKAGLLGTIAARLARVPHVVYTLHGLRLETTSGCKRRLLWLTEWIACHAADQVRSVSPSLRARVVGLGLVAPEHCGVTRSGSSNGVDVEHWRRSSLGEAAGGQARERLGIPPRSPLVGFVGRFTRDKGIVELYRAFTRLRSSYPDLRLLLVGDFEAGDPVPAALRAEIEKDSSVVVTGFVTEVATYYWAMDVLALPTYREGFPGVPLEAQAASVPVVSTDATGAVDALVDGTTGFRVPVGDVDALTAALDRLLRDPALRACMGEAGRKWVQLNFERETVWKSLLADYGAILQSAPRGRQSSMGRRVEPGFDQLAALLILILSAPLWLAAALAVRCSLGSPVLFRQRRPGLKGRPFTLLKFRTMRDLRDQNGVLLEDGQRMTPLGRLLRRLSVDELPQLWNVLRGEMSLVGPRPLLTQYLKRYTPEQARRHEVLPGITGWAQVNGRNAISWEAKFALDVWYVEHRTIWLDLKIVLMTAAKIVMRDGISQTGHATVPEFQGTQRN